MNLPTAHAVFADHAAAIPPDKLARMVESALRIALRDAAQRWLERPAVSAAIAAIVVEAVQDIARKYVVEENAYNVRAVVQRAIEQAAQAEVRDRVVVTLREKI